jgi:hypothetical protein
VVKTGRENALNEYPVRNHTTQSGQDNFRRSRNIFPRSIDSTEHVAKITSDLVAANPDLAGLCGVDDTTGPGLGLAVKEAARIVKLKSRP